MATTETYATNRLYTIPLAELMPDPNQPRKFHDHRHSNPLTGKKESVIIALNNLKRKIDAQLRIALGKTRTKNWYEN